MNADELINTRLEVEERKTRGAVEGVSADTLLRDKCFNGNYPDSMSMNTRRYSGTNKVNRVFIR